MSRGAVGWALFVVLAQLARLPRWIAGPGEIERRLADRAWLEQRPPDYDTRRPW